MTIKFEWCRVKWNLCHSILFVNNGATWSSWEIRQAVIELCGVY